MSNRGLRHSFVQPLGPKKGFVAEAWISCTGYQVTTPRLLFHTHGSAVFSWASGRPGYSIHHARCGGLGSTNTNSVRVFWDETKSNKGTVLLPVCVLDYTMNARSLSRIIMCCNQNDPSPRAPWIRGKETILIRWSSTLVTYVST